MIRSLILGGALALGLGTVALADGFEPGREPGYRSMRAHQAVRRQHHVRRYVPRRSYGLSFVSGAEPGRLTNNLNVPIYNIPPRRFP